MACSNTTAGDAFFRNRLLAGTPPETLGLFRRRLTRVSLVSGQVLHERGEAVQHVYFIEHGLASVITPIEDDGAVAVKGGVEIGLIGADGLVGWWVLLDPEAIAPQRTLVQIPGDAWRMTVIELRDAAEREPVLRQLLLRYAQAVTIQVAQTAACNASHALPERLARWLLMAHDRVGGDELPLTQEFLGLMLGARRSGVTVAAGTLQQAGLIRYSRGRIAVLDRAGLEGTSCECYRLARSHFERLVGPAPEQP